MSRLSNKCSFTLIARFVRCVLPRQYVRPSLQNATPIRRWCLWLEMILDPIFFGIVCYGLFGGITDVPVPHMQWVRSPPWEGTWYRDSILKTARKAPILWFHARCNRCDSRGILWAFVFGSKTDASLRPLSPSPWRPHPHCSIYACFWICVQFFSQVAPQFFGRHNSPSNLVEPWYPPPRDAANHTFWKGTGPLRAPPKRGEVTQESKNDRETPHPSHS